MKKSLNYSHVTVCAGSQQEDIWLSHKETLMLVLHGPKGQKPKEAWKAFLAEAPREQLILELTGHQLGAGCPIFLNQHRLSPKVMQMKSQQLMIFIVNRSI